jgi:hypothetical protein
MIFESISPRLLPKGALPPAVVIISPGTPAELAAGQLKTKINAVVGLRNSIFDQPGHFAENRRDNAPAQVISAKKSIDYAAQALSQ